MKRLLKFLTTGGLAAGVEYAVYILLQLVMGTSILFIPQTISFLAGFLVSFSLNKNWVFANKRDTKRQLLKYSLLAGINLVLSNLMLWLFVDVIDLNQYLAKFIVMGMVATWNYFIFSKLIFNTK